MKKILSVAFLIVAVCLYGTRALGAEEATSNKELSERKTKVQDEDGREGYYYYSYRASHPEYTQIENQYDEIIHLQKTSDGWIGAYYGTTKDFHYQMYGEGNKIEHCGYLLERMRDVKMDDKILSFTILFRRERTFDLPVDWFFNYADEVLETGMKYKPWLHSFGPSKDESLAYTLTFDDAGGCFQLVNEKAQSEVRIFKKISLANLKEQNEFRCLPRGVENARLEYNPFVAW